MAAGTRAKGAAKMQAAHGHGGHCCHAAVWLKVRLLMVQTHSFRGCARSVLPTKAVKDKMSAVAESSPQHSNLHSEDSDRSVRGHWATHWCTIDAAKPCKAQMPEHGGWPMAQEAPRFHSRVAAVFGRPKVARILQCQPLLSRSTKYKVTAQQRSTSLA
jgi:hypothetical protein